MRASRLNILLFVCIAGVSVSCGGGGGGSNGGGANNSGGSGSSQNLTITTASILPATVQGHSYSTTLAAANGQGALHWSIAPVSTTALFVTGLSIDPITGTISGTANFGGTGGFIATVTDSASHMATAGFTITAYLPLTSAPSQTATLVEFGIPINVRSGITGGVPPLTFAISSGTIAPGLKFDSNGNLTGGAYQQGTFQFTLTAQDSFSPPETATQPFIITVTTPNLSIAPSLPSKIILNEPFNGKVIALGGASPYTFALANGSSLPAGLTLDPGTGIISGTASAKGAAVFTIQATDSSSTPQKATLFFDIPITTPLGRNDSPATATAIDNGSFNASISPYIDPPNGVPTAGDNDYYKLVSVGGATAHVETNAKRINQNNPLDTVIEIVDGNGVRLSTCRQPGDTSTTFASSCINDDISASPHVQDSALDFQVPGANNTTATFYVHVFDWRGDARPDMVYVLNVSGVLDPLVISPPRPATRGALYSQTLSAMRTNGTVSWSITGGSLPPGLTLANGVISGTATTDGSYSFTLQASDAGPPAQIGTAQETMIVGEPVKLALSGSLPSACVNQPYSFQVPTTGGTPPLSFGFVSMNWVPINLDTSTGIFSGTATVMGTFTGNVSVQDAALSGDSQTITLTVQQCP